MELNAKNIQRAIIDTVDGLLFGIPSTVLLNNIRKQYDVEYSDALRLVERIQDAINAENITQEDIIRRKDDILTQIGAFSPLSIFRDQLTEKYNQLNERQSASVARAADLTSQLTEASNKASEIAMKKGNSLGTEAEQRGMLL